MTSKTPVIFALFGLLAVAALPASAQYRHHAYYGSNWDGEFRLRVGAFEPDGDSAYWDGIRRDFTGSSTRDFQAPGNIVVLAVDKGTGSVLPDDTPGAIKETFIAGTQPGGLTRPQ